MRFFRFRRALQRVARRPHDCPSTLRDIVGYYGPLGGSRLAGCISRMLQERTRFPRLDSEDFDLRNFNRGSKRGVRAVFPIIR